MNWSPNYSNVLRKQATNLPALYALRGQEKQRERELDLQRRAQEESLALGKEQLATTERLKLEEMAANERSAREKLALDKSLAEAEAAQNERLARERLGLDKSLAELEAAQNEKLARESLGTSKSIAESEAVQREQLAKEQLEQTKEQVGTSNLIGGLQTGVSLATAGYTAYDWLKRNAAEKAAEAAKSALAGPSSGAGAEVAAGGSAGLGGAAGLSTLGEGVPMAEAAAGGYAGAGGTAGLGTLSAGTSAATGAEIGALSASEAAAAGGATGSTAAASGLGAYLGPAAVIALPVITGLSLSHASHKARDARNAWIESLSPEQNYAYWNEGYQQTAWEEAFRRTLGDPYVQRYNQAVDPTAPTSPVKLTPRPSWIVRDMQFNGVPDEMLYDTRYDELGNPYKVLKPNADSIVLSEMGKQGNWKAASHILGNKS